MPVYHSWDPGYGATRTLLGYQPRTSPSTSAPVVNKER